MFPEKFQLELAKKCWVVSFKNFATPVFGLRRVYFSHNSWLFIRKMLGLFSVMITMVSMMTMVTVMMTVMTMIVVWVVMMSVVTVMTMVSRVFVVMVTALTRSRYNIGIK